MTDLINLIFWTFLGILALASCIAMARMGYKPREKGPWLVCRVAADGSGGMEFFDFMLKESSIPGGASKATLRNFLFTKEMPVHAITVVGDVAQFWVRKPDEAHMYMDRVKAEHDANDLLADVVPLSRYK